MINSKIAKYSVPVISIAVLITLLIFYVGFIIGRYGPLYDLGIVSLVALPFVLIIGTIFSVIKRKWFLLGFGFVLLPISWLVTLIGSMSDPPFDPTNISMHMVHAAVVISGAFACWFYLTLIFWRRHP